MLPWDVDDSTDHGALSSYMEKADSEETFHMPSTPHKQMSHIRKYVQYISSQAPVHSTRSHVPVHSMTDEPPQHPLDEKELDNIALPKLETQVLVLHQSKRVSVPPSDYIHQMGGKTNAMNEQTETNQDNNRGLVYNHDEA